MRAQRVLFGEVSGGFNRGGANIYRQGLGHARPFAKATQLLNKFASLHEGRK